MTPTTWPLPCARCGDLRQPGYALVSATEVGCPACLLVGDGRPVTAAEDGLRPYQVAGVRRLAGSRGALLADDPGLGKTAQALRALAARGHPPALAIVPPGLRPQWAAEAHRWAPGYDRVKVLLPGEPWGWPEARQILVAGYTYARGFAFEGAPRAPTVVVLDEAQAVKNPSAHQTRGVRIVCAKAREAGGAVWLLTATPAYGHVVEAWEVLRAAGLERQLAPSRARAQVLTEERAKRELRKVMLRRRVEDVAPDLPACQVVQRVVALDAALRGEVDRAAHRAAAAHRVRQETGQKVLDDAGRARAAALDLPPAEVRAALEELADGGDEAPLATLRRLLALAKVPAAQELAAEYEAAGERVVVFSAHRAPVEALGKRPGWLTVLGGQAGSRQESVDRFARGEAAGIAGTLGALGTGVDGLHRASRRGVFVDRDWTPAINAQARGRLRRLGALGGAVLITELVADHPADEVVTRALDRKEAHLEAVGLGVGA